MEKFIVHTDGGARGNPGPAAIGVVIQDERGRTMKEYGEAIGETTNNVAEYRAVIFALKKLKQLIGKEQTKLASVEMRLDSELVVRQLNARYKLREKDLVPFFVEVWNLRQDFGDVTFRHIRREENKAADRLVNLALDSSQSRLGL